MFEPQSPAPSPLKNKIVTKERIKSKEKGRVRELKRE